ncbi:MAG: hypothetical protein ACO1TE_16915 [Prosthecobacter sp.]
MSSFEFKPESQQQMPEMAPPQGRIGPFSVGVILSFVVLVGIWAGWDPAEKAYRSWHARRTAAEVRSAIATQDWPNAYRLLAEARRRDPEDVDVISATVEFLKATKADPAGLAQQLRMLEKHRTLSDEEMLLMGRSLITIGRADEARKVHDKLPLAVASRQAGLQLLAEILAAEGHTKEARMVDNRAAAGGLAANDPQAMLKLSLQDKSSRFPEVRQKAREQLWETAERADAVALEAISALAADPALLLADADRLLEIVEKHSLATLATRLQVISAFVRLQPEQAPVIYQKEVARFQTDGTGRLEEIAFWLMKERQHDMIFRLVPVKLALKSRELYPILMQTMGQAGRWNELRDLLSMPNPPVPQSLVDLALAEVQARFQPDMRESRRLLEGTVKAAVTEGNVMILHRAAELAAKLNLVDIAASAYLQAGLKAATGATMEEALRCLQKSAESALMAKNTTILLAASRKLQELSPGSAAFADRLAYLRLILGVEMETVNLSSKGDEPGLRAMFTIAIERVPPSLLQALAAYRLGDLEAVRTHLASLPDASSLPAGQRAVAAGLLALAGRPDRAFEIAEKVPDALLLSEELAFLNHAR